MSKSWLPFMIRFSYVGSIVLTICVGCSLYYFLKRTERRPIGDLAACRSACPSLEQHHSSRDKAMIETDQSARLPLETGPDILVAPRSFYGAPWCDDIGKLDADVAFVGVPYDQGTPKPGARYAPNVLRDTRSLPSVPAATSTAGLAAISTSTKTVICSPASPWPIAATSTTRQATWSATFGASRA
jgi:hypothetical protein